MPTVFQIIALNVSDSFDITQYVQSLGMPDDASCSTRRLNMDGKLHIIACYSTNKNVDSLFATLSDDLLLSSVGRHNKLSEESAVEELREWTSRGYNGDGREDPIISLINMNSNRD